MSHDFHVTVPGTSALLDTTFEVDDQLSNTPQNQNSTTITITWSHVRHLLIKALSWNWDCKVHQDIKDSVSMTLSCHCSTRLPVLNEPVDNLALTECVVGSVSIWLNKRVKVASTHLVC